MMKRSTKGPTQTGDSIKTLESDYAKYIKKADDHSDFVEKQIQKSATQVKPASDVEHSPTQLETKSPRKIEGLKMERVRRVELPTLCLASIRSSQLSYTRMFISPTATVGRCQFHHARPSFTRPWRKRKNCT
jgi:hypothetical protein